MSITFITVQGSDDNGWNITEVTALPEFKINEKILASHFSDLKIANVAAKAIAEDNQIQLVPENTSVITVMKSSDTYLPISIGPFGKIQGEGQSVPTMEGAARQAHQYAQKYKLPLILPQKV